MANVRPASEFTAADVYAIAIGSAWMKEFMAALDAEIMSAALDGNFYICKYIKWTVPDEAVMTVAEHFKARGFTVTVADREETKYYTCDQWSDRSFQVSWKEIKNE